MARYRRGYCRCNRITCATCVVTPSGPHLKSHRAFLAPGMPEAKWLRTCNLYSGWKLWRDWTPPKPFVPETTAEANGKGHIRVRLIGKPVPGSMLRLRVRGAGK